MGIKYRPSLYRFLGSKKKKLISISLYRRYDLNFLNQIITIEYYYFFVKISQGILNRVYSMQKKIHMSELDGNSIRNLIFVYKRINVHICLFMDFLSFFLPL